LSNRKAASHGCPADGEHGLGSRALDQLLLEPVDQLVALVHGLVRDLEHLLPLAALLALQLMVPLPDLVLLLDQRSACTQTFSKPSRSNVMVPSLLPSAGPPVASGADLLTP